MGSWFLATAFSQFLAAIIAQFAAVNEGDDNFVPNPADSVHIYGDVYQMIAIMAVASGVFCLILAPLLKKWMHQEAIGKGEAAHALADVDQDGSVNTIEPKYAERMIR